MKPIWEEMQEDEEELKPRKLVNDDISGNGLYLHKSGHCVKLERVEGNGLYLTPHSRLGGVSDDGLYLKCGTSIYDGRGLLLDLKVHLKISIF